jgi:pyrimidine-nucleoside phosphorylase
VLDDPDRLDKAPCTMEVKAPEKGRILHMDTHQCGMAACMLGAGRETKEDEIDYSAGIVLKKKTGCVVEKGETLAVLHTSKKELLEPAASRFLKAVTVGTTGEVKKKPLILARVDDETVEWYR